MTDRDHYRGAIRATMAGLTAQSESETEVPLHQRLEAVTNAAVTLIRGADFADVMLIDDGSFESVAPTHPIIRGLDAVQMQHHEGPCLLAAQGDTVIRVRDLGSESRWPHFTAAAMAAGVRSALTFPLYTHRHGTGALNVFSNAAGALNVDDEAIGAMLATHAAILLIAASDDGSDMVSTLANNDLVGQAKGILMERFVIDSATAFDLMLARSHADHTTLPVVAKGIIGSV